MNKEYCPECESQLEPRTVTVRWPYKDIVLTIDMAKWFCINSDCGEIITTGLEMHRITNLLKKKYKEKKKKTPVKT